MIFLTSNLRIQFQIIIMSIKAGYSRASFLWQIFMWQVLFARLYAQLWQVAFEQVHLS
jgi:hypothetical protein